MRTSWGSNALSTLAVFLITALAAQAQVSYSTATLRGTVVDANGGFIAGATVSATNPAIGSTKTAKSGADGAYQFPELSPGVYDIEVEAKGFAKSVAKGIQLSVGQSVIYDVHLQVGTLNQIVEVFATAQLIEVSQSQQANTINELQVQQLPNVNRSFTQMIYTVPGVAYSHAPTIQDQNVGTGYLSSGFSFGGSTGRSNLVTIDGGENDYGSGALRVTHVPVDSIQEYQINRNSFSAEFGNTIGSAINMVTKSGTNTVHGSAYGYFHNEGTDAVNYFNQLQAPGAKPFEQSVISGVTLGAPIKKDKVFFFTSYEYQKLDQVNFLNLAAQTEFQPLSKQANGFTPGNPVTSQCPSQSTGRVTQLCYLTQLLNSGNQGLAGVAAFYMGLVPGMSQGGTFFSPLGDASMSIPAHPILQGLVAPNDGAFNGIVSYLGAERGIPGFNTPRGRYNNWVSRLDFLPSTKDSIFLRFSLLNESDNVTPQPPTSTFDHFTDYTVTTSWTRTFRPSLVNMVRVQMVPQNTALNRTPTNLQGPCGINSSTGALTGGCASEVDIGNQIVLGNPFAFPYDADWQRYQFDDTLSWLKGGHTVKLGGSYRPDYYKVNEQLWLGGQWSFTDGAIPMIAVFPSSANSCGPGVTCQQALAGFNLAAGYPVTGPTSTNLTGAQEYAFGLPIVLLQASPSSTSLWKAWDHILGLFAEDSWKISRKLTLNYGVRFDYEHAPSPVPASFHASPRLGVAWNPRGDGKTVIRAAGGLFVAPVLFMTPFYTNALGNSGKYINQGGLSAAYPAGFPAPSGCGASVASIFCAWGVQASVATPANPNPSLSPAELTFAGAGAILNPFGPTGVGTVFFDLAPNYRPAYSVQASMSVAREIAKNLSLEVGYNMYRSVHLQVNLETNYCNESFTNSGAFCGGTPVPADPFVGPFYKAKQGVTTNAQGASQLNALIFQNNTYSSVGNGIYNGLTASLTKKYGAGLQFQANYTYSRAIDDTSDYSSLTTPFRSDLLNLDRSVSLFNITHTFTANAVYNTPFGAGTGNAWASMFADVSISPIITVHSGFPFTLLVPGLGGGAGNGNGGHISQARPFNEPRNTAIGPDFASWDMRVSKAFYIRRDSGLRVNVIGQATNLLNRTNFAAVNNNFPADPNFKLPSGGTLLSGPYRVRGFAPTSPTQLSTPLAFTKAYPARQVSVGLQIVF